MAFNKNLEEQLSIIPQTINQHRELNPEHEKELKLEYLFYTNKIEKAEKLATEMKRFNYSATVSTFDEKEKLFIITGWTNKMKLEDESIKKWISQMCQLGYKFDCKFDIWRTNSI